MVTCSLWGLIGSMSLMLRIAEAQDDTDVSQCALDCIANVNGTTCGQASWSCLCQNQMYINRTNTCVYNACNTTEEAATFSAVAELCAIVGFPITVGPEATASIITSDGIFSTVGIPSVSSLPPIVSPSTSTIDNSALPSTSTGAPSSITEPSITAQTSSSAPAAATSNRASASFGPVLGPPMLLLFMSLLF